MMSNNLIDRIANYFPLIAQVCRFGIVGLTAATVHFSIVVYLVQAHSFVPLIANVFAFGISFQLSYFGHRMWTFSETIVTHKVAASKLLFVQIVNFGLNELLFFIFLSFHLPYTIALLIVLAVLPIFTFFISKVWVFRHV